MGQQNPQKNMLRRIRTKVLVFLVASLLHLVTAAQAPPFLFGNATGDLFAVPGADAGATTTLPQAMAYVGRNVIAVRQYVDGYISLFSAINPLNFSGYVNAYYMNIDTSNGGADQNQVWLRVGKNQSDLQLARDIIAGNGTLFAPQAIIVATWYKVEAAPRRVGPQNTFQLAMAYSETGETWVIYAYSQLEYFASSTTTNNASYVEYKNSTNRVVQNFFTINSNTTMMSLLNGTNCNRTGTYAYRINKGGPTKAPTKSPTKPPTKAPTKPPTKAPIKVPTKVPTVAPIPDHCGLLGWSIFCPLTFCGILGRWLGFCQSP
jgi:hypothetical protein